MRRLLLEEPVSRAAEWSPRVAYFSVLVGLIAVALLRFGLVDLRAGTASIGAALATAVIALLLSAAGFVRIWTEGRRGVAPAVGGVVMAALVLAYPATFAFRWLTLPALTDVTTDIDNPPAFSRSQAALQARGLRIPPDAPLEDRVRQREAYPQVAPLTLDIPPEEAFDIVRRAAAERGWQIIESARPGGRIGLGRVDAVDRSPLLRLPDDVTVRLRPRADGTRIDVRSASRFGRHDFGSNATRIRRFLDEVSALAIAAK